MSWYQEWQALSARIHGLLDAGSFFYSTLIRNSGDGQSVRTRVLLPTAKGIFGDLTSYLKDCGSVLPGDARVSLQRFLETPNVKGLDFAANGEAAHSVVQFALTSLAAFRSEFSYILSDTQAVALRITERAFAHLQRSIVADDEVREKWLRAFCRGETTCEKLGSLHLLSHGVWAFKAHAEKGRTDLVLNEPLGDMELIERTSTALVLTEWKIVTEAQKLETKIKEAYGQTRNYSAGVLGGIELVNYRYLVMVSEKSMVMPPDSREGNLTYRHINVPVKPEPPSTESRKP